MKEIYLRNDGQKKALVDAVQHHIEVLNDELGGQVDELDAWQEGWQFDTVLSNIQTTRKEIAFLTSFLPALQSHPVGVGGVFLEAFEVGVIKSALAALADIQQEHNNETDNGILSILSAENIKNTIRSTAQSWGAIDPERLAIELARQVRQALESKGTAKELLNQLS